MLWKVAAKTSGYYGKKIKGRVDGSRHPHIFFSVVAEQLTGTEHRLGRCDVVPVGWGGSRDRGREAPGVPCGVQGQRPWLTLDDAERRKV